MGEYFYIREPNHNLYTVYLFRQDKQEAMTQTDYPPGR